MASMTTRAAVLHQPGTDWEITELELDPPKEYEVLIRYKAAGLCHSDEHLRSSDMGSEAGAPGSAAGASAEVDGSAGDAAGGVVCAVPASGSPSTSSSATPAENAAPADHRRSLVMLMIEFQ